MRLNNVKINTKIKVLYPYQIHKIITLATNWCVENFGVRKYCPTFDMELVKECKDERSGWYLTARHDPKITINLSQNTDVLDMIDTIIHEYTHYLTHNFMEVYTQFETENSYKTHPLEIDARNQAKQYRRKCFTEIKNLF